MRRTAKPIRCPQHHVNICLAEGANGPRIGVTPLPLRLNFFLILPARGSPSWNLLRPSFFARLLTCLNMHPPILLKLDYPVSPRDISPQYLCRVLKGNPDSGRRAKSEDPEKSLNGHPSGAPLRLVLPNLGSMFSAPLCNDTQA